MPVPRDRLALKAVAFLLASGLVVAGTYAARLFTGNDRDAPRVAGLTGETGATSPSERSEIERLIRAYEAQVRATPNTTALLFLSQLYMAKARITGDLGTYAQAEAAVDAATARSPATDDVLLASASVRFALHEFPEALRLASVAHQRDPSRLDVVAVMSDASMEMGDIDRAAKLLASLARAAPGSAAVDVRRSRLAALTGDANQARALAARASDEAAQSGVPASDRAFYRSVQAQIELDSGHYTAAERMYADSLSLLPGYAPSALGSARSLAALGKTRDAVVVLEELVAHIPLPDAFALLGDLYTVMGDQQAASRQYDAVLAIGTLSAANKQVYNRQLATFFADHNIKISDAVTLATKELLVRRDAHGYDVHAWALFRAGRLQEAASSMASALASGVKDARILYHAGLIASSLGETRVAIERLRTALAISPHFDVIHAPIARKTLAELMSR